MTSRFLSGWRPPLAGPAFSPSLPSVCLSWRWCEASEWTLTPTRGQALRRPAQSAVIGGATARAFADTPVRSLADQRGAGAGRPLGHLEIRMYYRCVVSALQPVLLARPMRKSRAKPERSCNCAETCAETVIGVAVPGAVYPGAVGGRGARTGKNRDAQSGISGCSILRFRIYGRPGLHCDVQLYK